MVVSVDSAAAGAAVISPAKAAACPRPTPPADSNRTRVAEATFSATLDENRDVISKPFAAPVIRTGGAFWQSLAWLRVSAVLSYQVPKHVKINARSARR